MQEFFQLCTRTSSFEFSVSIWLWLLNVFEWMNRINLQFSSFLILSLCFKPTTIFSVKQKTVHLQYPLTFFCVRRYHKSSTKSASNFNVVFSSNGIFHFKSSPFVFTYLVSPFVLQNVAELNIWVSLSSLNQASESKRKRVC